MSSVPTMTSQTAGLVKGCGLASARADEAMNWKLHLELLGSTLCQRQKQFDSTAFSGSPTGWGALCLPSQTQVLSPSNTDSHSDNLVSSLEQNRKCLHSTLLAGECGLILGGELIIE